MVYDLQPDIQCLIVFQSGPWQPRLHFWVFTNPSIGTLVHTISHWQFSQWTTPPLCLWSQYLDSPVLLKGTSQDHLWWKVLATIGVKLWAIQHINSVDRAQGECINNCVQPIKLWHEFSNVILALLDVPLMTVECWQHDLVPDVIPDFHWLMFVFLGGLGDFWQ